MVVETTSIALQVFIGIPLAIFMLSVTWFLYKLVRTIIPAMEVEEAYKYKRLRTEIEKRGIDFKEMMQEFYEAMPSYKYKKVGILNRVDWQVDGELEDEPEKKGKAK